MTTSINNNTATRALLVDAAEVRRAVTGAGSHFFDAAAMRFFASRTARTGWFVPTNDGTGGGHWVLVTSEQFKGLPGTEIKDEPRRYTVRHWLVGDYGRTAERIDTLDDFQAFATAAAAHRAAAKLVAELTEGVAR
jgi:hypothetical protein